MILTERTRRGQCSSDLFFDLVFGCGVVFVCVYSIDITSIMSDTQSNKYLQNCNPHIMNSFREKIGKRKGRKTGAANAQPVTVTLTVAC